MPPRRGGLTGAPGGGTLGDMSQPNRRETNSSEAPQHDAAPARSAEPPLRRPEKYTQVKVCLGQQDLGPQGRDSESLQVSIAELLLATLIVAVILSVLAMLPDGYSPPWAIMGILMGQLVLMALRPNRAITRLGSWLSFGGVFAMLSRWPITADLRLMFSALMLAYVLKFAFALQERHGMGKVFLGAFVFFPLFLAVLVGSPRRDSGNIPWWLPLALYLVATGIGAWRLWRPAGGRSPPRSP